MAEMRSGYVDYRGFKTYYEIYGECRPGKKPLLILHGGPGDTHLYLLNYRDMADLYGRQIIFYDQIGCGKSNIPHQDDDFYGYDLWIDEFYTMRDALGLDDFHLFGNSWGGMLAMMCACKDDAGIRSMVINGSPVNIATWLSEANRLIEYMPKDMQEAIAEAERTGDYDTPAAKAAYMEYYRRHVVGVEPWPDYVQEAFSEENVGECYMVMQGASEFVVTGKMRDFDIREDVKNIKVPTMMLSGTNDEASPLVVKEGYDLIPNCEWTLIQGAAHVGNATHGKEYMAAVEEFISRHE
ncbi:MAG: proline iminopeptidase-family hydrolase [Slackia sp.]|uniref:proline iminopeptidase-family hydrolase n=1 Tax=Slackia TaxID=84108 RepID=UPI00027C6682|nr:MULTISPECIES: proline iminopeptidase-family hydrolase [Slackia]EJU33409.1 putative prolyl aminopeptidase [Slackia sp. CM382]MCK6139313.1 proline iminopeptidase-family hydrolase [Slackia exigua]MCQ5092111.1 proline iminopeptidase-family hydrolase [Slackia exigua]MDU6011086.1 proline iminopeptidase-family hydrolase [Slackia sp.]